MAEGVGVWAMELTHVLCLYMDLYTNDRPNYLNNYDNMDCSCGTHPTAYTKVQLGWLDPSAIVVESSRAAQFDLHTLGLVQPLPPGMFATTGDAPVAAITRNPDRIDLFIAGRDGRSISLIGTPQAGGRRSSESTLRSRRLGTPR